MKSKEKSKEENLLEERRNHSLFKPYIRTFYFVYCGNVRKYSAPDSKKPEKT